MEMTAKKMMAVSLPDSTREYIKKRAKEIGVTNTKYVAALVIRDILSPLPVANIHAYGSIGNSETGGIPLEDMVSQAFSKEPAPEPIPAEEEQIEETEEEPVVEQEEEPSEPSNPEEPTETVEPAEEPDEPLEIPPAEPEEPYSTKRVTEALMAFKEATGLDKEPVPEPPPLPPYHFNRKKERELEAEIEREEQEEQQEQEEKQDGEPSIKWSGQI